MSAEIKGTVRVGSNTGLKKAQVEHLKVGDGFSVMRKAQDEFLMYATSESVRVFYTVEKVFPTYILASYELTEKPKIKGVAGKVVKQYERFTKKRRDGKARMVTVGGYRSTNVTTPDTEAQKVVPSNNDTYVPTKDENGEYVTIPVYVVNGYEASPETKIKIYEAFKVDWTDKVFTYLVNGKWHQRHPNHMFKTLEEACKFALEDYAKVHNATKASVINSGERLARFIKYWEDNYAEVYDHNPISEEASDVYLGNVAVKVVTLDEL